MSCKPDVDISPPLHHSVISEKELAGRRLLIVGDIHGCLDEFQTLLANARVTSNDTLVICCGDLINKGPKNCETLAFIRSLGSHAVRSVRGNHDESVSLSFVTLLTLTLLLLGIRSVYVRQFIPITVIIANFSLLSV